MKRFKHIFACGVFFLIACLGIGCASQKIDGRLNLINYPSFFSSSETYISLAIAPVENTVDPGLYTPQLNRKIVEKFKDRSAYEVYDYTNKNMNGSELITHLREKGDIDLVLLSSVVDYSEEYSERVDRRYETETIYVLDAEGNQVYDEYGRAIIERTYDYTYDYSVYGRTTHATMLIQLIDVASGNSIWTDKRDGDTYSEEQSMDDFGSITDSRQLALDNVIFDIVRLTSPLLSGYTFKYADDVIRIQRLDDDEWEDETDIPFEEEVKLTFKFPSYAKYNTFSFDIIATESQKKLAGDKMYYEDKDFEYKFKMSDLVNLADGEEKFEVRLWDYKGIVVSREFEVD